MHWTLLCWKYRCIASFRHKKGFTPTGQLLLVSRKQRFLFKAEVLKVELEKTGPNSLYSLLYCYYLCFCHHHFLHPCYSKYFFTPLSSPLHLKKQNSISFYFNKVCSFYSEKVWLYDKAELATFSPEVHELSSVIHGLCIMGKCTESENIIALGTISCQQLFSTASRSICYLERCQVALVFIDETMCTRSFLHSLFPVATQQPLSEAPHHSLSLCFWLSFSLILTNVLNENFKPCLEFMECQSFPTAVLQGK